MKYVGEIGKVICRYLNNIGALNQIFMLNDKGWLT